MPGYIKRPLLLAAQRSAAKTALKEIEKLSPALAKIVREYFEAEETFERQLIGVIVSNSKREEPVQAG